MKGDFIIRLLIFLTVLSPYTTIAAAVYISFIVIIKKQTIHKNYLNIGLFSLFIWSLISGCINHSAMSISTSFVLLLYFFFSVFVHNSYNDLNKVESVFNYLVYFSLGSVVIGLIEKLVSMIFNADLSLNFINTFSSSGINHRISSTFANPNVAGNWFAIMTIIALYLYNTNYNNKKSFYRITIILFVISLCLTGSRGAFIGLLFGLLVYFFINNKKKDLRIFATLFILIAIFTFAPSEVLKYVTGHSIDDSFNSRFDIWVGSLKMIKLKPLSGWGLTGFIEHGSHYIKTYGYRTIYHGHNIWITITATLGIPGLMIYMFIKVNLFKNLISLYENKNRLVPLLGAIQAVVIAHGVVDFTIITPQAGLMFILSSAMISSLAFQNNNQYIKKNVNGSLFKSVTRVS